MNITNNFSPAFKGSFVQDNKMTQKQRNLGTEIINAISYSDEYLDADAQHIDVYITPDDKNKGSVKVRYMDDENGYYFRKNNKIVETKVSKGKALKEADNILTQLGNILSGEYGFRGFDAYMHENKKSDLYKIRPEYIEKLAKSIERI